MTTRERIQKKTCPQCGWDAEGQPVEDAAAAAQIAKRVPPPQKFDYDCGNCGFRWIE